MVNVGFIFYSSGADWHGGKNYFRSLFSSLESLSPLRVQPIAFLGKKLDPAEYDFSPCVRIVHDAVFDRYSPSWFFDRIAKKTLSRSPCVNQILSKYNVDLLSHSDPFGIRGVFRIGWIPDFQHLHFPHFFLKSELAKRNSQFRIVLRNSDIVLVSSESARRDLSLFAPEYSHKARLLRFCALMPSINRVNSQWLIENYGLQDPYFYIPNQFWAHKNHAVVIDAFVKISSRYPSIKIICSGALSDYRNPDHINKIRATINKQNLSGRFVLLGLIPYEHIAQLMIRSIAVINPSFFEGWSTTVEEAKSLGVPLILSDIAVHREQCLERDALFFDPHDSCALAEQLQNCLESIDDPGTRKVRVVNALNRHSQVVHDFAMTYQNIVLDLAKQSCVSRIE